MIFDYDSISYPLLRKILYPNSKSKYMSYHEQSIIENVLDVFGGSGSTLIACEQNNRNCYVMELEPKWVDVIIQRWENFTGKKAIKL
jgi:DNA modification methylase